MSNVFASQKTSAQHPSRAGTLHVVIAGPELIAHGLNCLLSFQAEIETLTPLPDVQRIVDVTLSMRELHRPVDVVVLDWNGNAAYHDVRLHTLSLLSRYQQACLVMVATVSPEEIEHIKQAGTRGYISTSSSFSQLIGAIRLLAGNKEATYFPTLPEHSSASNDYTDLAVSRQVVFHQERLDAYARSIGWELTAKEIDLFRYCGHEINDIAERVNRPSQSVRHDLSQRVYPFLALLSGRPVNKRIVAFQVLLEQGILEYIPI